MKTPRAWFRTVLPAVLFLTTSGFVQAQSAAAAMKQRPVLAPIEDVDGLPRVLLIGDSISIGYTLQVRALLKGEANVHRPPTNCGPTTKGLDQVADWLDVGGVGKRWDVIHFNWGLHDLKFMGPNGENLADPAAPTSRRQVPPDAYEENLRTLVARLKQTGADLIWRNTTPVPTGARGRVPGDSAAYNEIAARVMEAAGIPTQDLFGFARARLAEIQRPADVHFTAEGSQALAEQVAETIRSVLPARRPNVIILFTDDQGSVDMNIYGATDLETPNMDALARRGTRFTQFYAAAPVCSPSRVGLMTGRTPQRGGLHGNVAPGSEGMPSAQVTVAEELKKAGYATAHIGKWHLGHWEETIPTGQGFDYSFGHLLGCIDNYSHFFYWNGPNRHDLWRNGEEVFHNGEFFPDLMVREASAFIEQNADRPFFLYFALNTPHYPYQGTPEWLHHYRDLPYPRNLYAAFLSTTDQRIGTLLQRVDDLGLTRDTIVVFQSDHGASTEVRAHGGGGSAGPYRGAKFSLYEGGLRIPAILSWPGHVPENEVRHQLATGCDWYPTLLDLCGLPQPAHTIDGKSLVPVVKDADRPSAHRQFQWKSGKAWAVREGDWKLIVTGAKIELYDIPNDPGEADNRASDHPDLVSRLTAAGGAYWQSLNTK